MFFLRVQTQWNVGASGAVGLNYQSVEFLFKIYKVKNQKKLLRELREIEMGALDALRRKSEDK